MYYSIFHNNQSITGKCNVGGRLLEYSFIPVNMAGSIYDLTPHFVLNLIINKHQD